MSSPVISVRGLGKKYRLGETIRHDTLRDKIAHSLKSLFAREVNCESRNAKCEIIPQSAIRVSQSADFWALKDVSFDVQQGEVLGIIGRNGAGKSTLLKILSQITEPTEGEIHMRGRVASLLEVGTGFHPELTGRENIFLNGAILGMARAEIVRKFDEIVAFSEVEKFIDTPVKRYSSGMYVRLAFAVAAHLEPEILIVDEVLAVGDANFQKKCLGKMEDVAHEGRTVLFVSHNMHAVSLLCGKALLLEAGRVRADGLTAKVIGNYLASHTNQSAEAVWAFAEAPGTENVKLHAVRAMSGSNRCVSSVNMDEPIRLEMDFWILRKTRMTPSFHIYNQQGILLFAVSNLHDATWAKREYEPGAYQCSCIIPGNYLNEGRHYMTVYLTRDNNAGLIDILEKEVISFEVRDRGASRSDYVHEWIGLVRPVLPWMGMRIGDLPLSLKAS